MGQRLRDLTEFPASALSNVSVRTLSLYGVFAYGARIRIPDGIGKLRELRRLDVGQSSLRELPEAIGKLSKLESLTLDYAEALTRLPQSLGKLKKLKRLELTYTHRLKKLPDSIGGCEDLELLNPEPSGLVSVPASLWKCSKLRVLELPDGVKKLPPGIGNLRKLRSLRLTPDALWSIRGEIPKLVSLRRLRVWGETDRVPDEIGHLPKLRELEILFTKRLARLPVTFADLKTLRRLDVTGNALTELASTVRALPGLEELSFAENKLRSSERRELDAWMRLPPSKRRSGEPAPAKSTRTAAKLLGTVASINAYLDLLLVDGSHAPAWHGAGDSEDEASDWKRFLKATGKKLAGPIAVGRGKGLAVSPAIGHGRSLVYAIDGGLAIVEGFLEDEKDKLFLEWVASPRAKEKRVGTVDLASGSLVITPSTDGCEDVQKRLARLSQKAYASMECGSDDASLLVRVPAGTYDVFVEPEVDRSWGSARRTSILARA
jgi:hypothetical protein